MRVTAKTAGILLLTIDAKFKRPDFDISPNLSGRVRPGPIKNI